jgi:endonuclease YncB( thermonuclease family)
VKRRAVPIIVLLALAAAVTVTATASKDASDKKTARVVGVPAADTLLVKIGKAKKAVRMHVLGVRAPAGGSCYAGQALAETRGLALAKQVVVSGDVKSGAAVTVGGGDLGLLLVAHGSAQVDPAAAFARLPQYAGAQEAAERAHTGMRGACGADVYVSMSGPDTGFPGQNLAYDVAVTNVGPLTAKSVRVFLRPGAYNETLASAKLPDGSACAQQNWMAVCTLQGITPGTTVHVATVMRGSRFGIMSGRAEVALDGCVASQCADTPLLDPNVDNNRAAVITLLPGGGYEKACEKSYTTVCIPLTPPDLDCEDFLPLKNFPVRHDLPNSDPHHLDGNGDGIACDAEDY